MTEEKIKAEASATRVGEMPLVITVHGAPLDASCLRDALLQNPDAVALLDPRGLRAESVQRAEARFFDFYNHAASAARDCGKEALFLCPIATPEDARRSFFPRELLLSHLTALLRVSAPIRVAPVFPCADPRVHFSYWQSLLEEAMHTLFLQGVPFDEFLPLGILPASPDAMLAADTLLEEADFLVIDTDLPWVDGEKEPIRVWKEVVAAARRMGRLTAVCGQNALRASYLSPLLDMGIGALCYPYADKACCFDKIRAFFESIT